VGKGMETHVELVKLASFDSVGSDQSCVRSTGTWMMGSHPEDWGVLYVRL
jgi:hypothetical protein